MEELKLLQNDPWLAPYKEAIHGRYAYALHKEQALVQEMNSLADFATGYLYFGLHKISDGWVMREWAPNATEVFLVGDCNNGKLLRSTVYIVKKMVYGKEYLRKTLSNINNCINFLFVGMAVVEKEFLPGYVG